MACCRFGTQEFRLDPLVGRTYFILVSLTAANADAGPSLRPVLFTRMERRGE